MPGMAIGACAGLPARNATSTIRTRALFSGLRPNQPSRPAAGLTSISGAFFTVRRKIGCEFNAARMKASRRAEKNDLLFTNLD